MRFYVVYDELDDFLSLFRTDDIIFPIIEFDEETLFFMCYEKPDFSIHIMAEIAPIAVCSPASACPNGFVKKPFFILNNTTIHYIRHIDFNGSNRSSDYYCIFRNN